MVIAETRREADAAIDEILFLRKFGTAGQRIVIEDFLPGEEASFFALCDGETAIPFGAAQDHKRAYDGDKGPNTGGMGAYSPAPIFTDTVREQTMERIILPTLRGMKAEGRPIRRRAVRGTDDHAGRAEADRVQRALRRSGMPNLDAAAEERSGAGAAGGGEGRTRQRAAQSSGTTRPAVTVVYAAQGYPDEPLTGSVIRGVAQADARRRTS